VDADGIFLLSEGRGLEALGLKPGEVVGQSVFDFYKDYPELIAMIRRSLAGEDFVGDTPVGGRHWHNRYIPHRNEEGDVIGLFGLSMDITEHTEAEEERKRFEAQLQHTQKLESLGVLAGGIAHDFNNLLTGILGNADLALLKLASASPARNNLAEIETAARRAAELCGQMLAYSGKGRFVVEAVSINELVEEMAHLVEISISKKAVLRYDFADNLPAIEADATQMRQIVLNLITNASEAIGEKSGVISISTGAMECDGDYLTETYLDEQLNEGVYVYVEVSDSGCGMDAETQAKIFDPFFTTKFTGRGLGLAAVLGIIRGHGGAIKVYSEPGKGTTFKALFPALDGPAAASRETNSQVEDWQGSGTALLVDDEETVRTVGKLMLEEMGFDVTLAVDGRDGVEKFREHQDEIALVLLDMTMPGMGGEETFREIRRIKPDAAVILSSGYNEQEVTSRFAGKGLAGFIQKPYQYQTLLEKVREVLAD
jgi:signal transduction histidine kinase/CheY-like chemotaxis protein